MIDNDSLFEVIPQFETGLIMINHPSIDYFVLFCDVLGDDENDHKLKTYKYFWISNVWLAEILIKIVIDIGII